MSGSGMVKKVWANFAKAMPKDDRGPVHRFAGNAGQNSDEAMRGVLKSGTPPSSGFRQ
jgi:hypothetical protein